jgi:poly(A) polymerase
VTPALNIEAFVTDLVERPGEALARHGEAVPELAALRGCPQPPNHHAEGDVWAHTELALGVLEDLPAAIDRHAGAALAAAGLQPLSLPGRTLDQALGVLLHDVAKPATIAGPEGGWTFYHHDRIGASVARTLIDRLGLAPAAVRMGLTLDPDEVAWLVAEHLFWLNTDVDAVTDRAVARRFVRDDGWDEDLRVVSWCDTLGSRGPDGMPHVDLLVAAEQRIAATRARVAAQATTPPQLLDGHEVMAVLDIPPGPQVGAVLAELRRRCSTEDEARALLRAERDRLRSAHAQ